MTLTISKLQSSIDSKISHLESDLRHELCENLETFTEWEKVMSTNVSDLRKTIAGKLKFQIYVYGDFKKHEL